MTDDKIIKQQQYLEQKRLLETEWRIEKKRCKEYNFFFRASWPEVEPVTPLVWNWHIDILCKELQTQAERIAARRNKDYDIIINIPPRSLKSSLTSKNLIPYVWTQWPAQKFLTASFSKDLALEHAVDSRSLILSPWYQRHWEKAYQLTSDQNVKSYYKNSETGYRMAVSVGQSSIGKGADWILIDDPNDPKTAESKIVRMNCINWFLKVMYSRLNNQRIGIRVIVQQRTFEDDLTGYMLANFHGAYKLFCFPGEETKDISPPEVKNYYSHKLFFPERFTKDILQDYRKTLGSDYSGQILQAPAPPEGNIFKRQWWRFWKPRGLPLTDVTSRIGDQVITHVTEELPEQFDDKIISWDMGLKGKEGNDPSAGHVWARTPAKFYLLNRVWGLFDDLKCEQEAEALKIKHPDASLTIIEDKAAGTPVIRRLQLKMPGVMGKNPIGDKRYRARNMAAYAQSGNIYLPHPATAPWIWDFIEYFSLFDRGRDDDDIDAASQAINHFIDTKRVFAGYNGTTKLFRVAWDELSSESRLIISQYVERNQRSSILIILYNSKAGILRVLAEFAAETASPEIIIPALIILLRVIGAENIPMARINWFGNDLMFQKACDDVASQYLNKKIFIQSVAFNELGAILKVVRMLTAEKLVIHQRAKMCAEDMISWTYKKTNEADDGHGLARALCVALDAIDENVRISKNPKGMKEYSKEKTAFFETLDQIARSGKLDEYKTGEVIINSENKSGWAMV